MPVTTDNFAGVCKNFGVTAVDADGKLFMSDEEVGVFSGGVWSPSNGARYWPEGMLDFYAYAPYSFNEKKLPLDRLAVDNTAKTVSFTYAVPTTADGNDAKAQPDVMFAYRQCSRDMTEGKNGTVPLTFSHALAGVRFVAKDIAGCTINKITLKGLYGKGGCVYDAEAGTFAWTLSTDSPKQDFTQAFGVKLNDQQTGEQQITDVNKATTFMMLPQTLGDATVEITLTTDDGIQHTLTGKLAIDDLTEWEAGNIYTYAISSESINWTYVFDVTENITLLLGGTTGKYTVTSYRYRTQNPSVREPVAWTATADKATETEYPSTTPTQIDIKGIIEDFTYSGDGNKDGGTEYDMLLNRTSMHTTYKDDEKLRTATPKGTTDNPYDLSTEGGAMQRTTANCYVVGAPGTYKLPLVYGNAIVGGQTNVDAYGDSHFVDYNGRHITNPWIKNSGGQPHDCTLVWSDGFYMFKDVKLSADGDYLVFTLDKDYMQQANAIVAVRDAGGNIMWSWHIWVIERDVNSTITVDDYWDSGKTYQIMSCNLGWVDEKMVYYNPRNLYFTFTQDKTGEIGHLHVTQEGAQFDYKDVGSTYYQWGRKDPIVALMNREHTGVNDYRRLETTDSKYLYKVDWGGVSMAKAIQNPNVYYVQPQNRENKWLDSNSFTDKLWNMSGRGDVRLSNSVKTVYDPSPRGFKVPVPRAFSVFVNGCDQAGYVDGGIEKGGQLNGEIDAEKPYKYHVYTKKNKGGERIPFTATGQRASRDGIDGDQNKAGCLWALDGVYYWTCNDTESTGVL